MKVRVIQRWTKHPETGQRIDLSYEMQQEDENGNWKAVPIVDEEVDFPFEIAVPKGDTEGD
jgi:hypothetical protein